MANDPLPVATLTEAAPYFRRPFTPEALKFRPVGGGTIVAYLDARTVIERLNAVIPGGWSTRFEPFPGGKQIICHLTIDGITRSDVGTQGTGNMIDPVKMGYSDAIKRAAVHFGVGVSVYALKRVRMSELPPDGISGDGKSKTLTPAGEKWLREGYRRWLDGPGKKHFGEALDHGDEEGAAGSLAEDEAPGEVVEAPSQEVIEAKERIELAYDDLSTAQRKGLSKAKLGAQVKAAEADGLDALTKLEAEVKGRADA